MIAIPPKETRANCPRCSTQKDTDWYGVKTVNATLPACLCGECEEDIVYGSSTYQNEKRRVVDEGDRKAHEEAVAEEAIKGMFGTNNKKEIKEQKRQWRKEMRQKYGR